jgi:hypothetical protein
MTQLDTLIIFPIIFGLLITLFLHYSFMIQLNIPVFFGAVKFRLKKINYYYKFFN